MKKSILLVLFALNLLSLYGCSSKTVQDNGVQNSISQPVQEQTLDDAKSF